MLFVIVRVDPTIQCFLDSPIKSGNDFVVLAYDIVYNCPALYYAALADPRGAWAPKRRPWELKSSSISGQLMP
jgi:hypothetical protein